MNLLELWESDDFEPLPMLEKKKKNKRTKWLRIKFPVENLVETHISISSRSGTRGAPKIVYKVLELESRFTLLMNAVKNIDCIKKMIQTTIVHN